MGRHIPIKLFFFVERERAKRTKENRHIRQMQELSLVFSEENQLQKNKIKRCPINLQGLLNQKN